MSYMKNLDEYTRLELIEEIRRREDANEKGICDYCGKNPDRSSPCRFPRRHAVRNRRDFLLKYLEDLES